MPRSPSGPLGPCILLLALACGGCGSDDEPAPPATGPGADSTVETATGEAGAPGAQGERRPGGEPGESSLPEPDGRDGASTGSDPERCRFEAPSGRLASDAIAIDLSGTNCEQGRRLAEAAALGQPAGANIPVRRDGFECEPSTRERGVNVEYACEKGSGAASFRIEWTTEP